MLKQLVYDNNKFFFLGSLPILAAPFTPNPFFFTISYFSGNSERINYLINQTDSVRSNFLTRFFVLLICIVLFSIGAKSQTTYYVNDNSRIGDYYTSSTGNDANPGTASAPFATINQAVSAAVNGDIIYVDAGTFTGQLEITKQLSLIGLGAGITNINSPDVLALSYTIPPNTTVHRPVVFVHDAAGVIIKNITVNGLGKGNTNVRFQGIAYRNAGGTIQDCEVKAIRNTPIDGAQAGVAVYANADNGTPRTLNLIHNTLIDYQKNATVLAGANLTINVNNNTVTGAGPLNLLVQNGFQVSDGASGSITNNTVSNINYISSTVVAVGILVFGPGNVQTTGNTITNVQAGIYHIRASGSITNNVVTNTPAGMGATPYWYGITVEKGSYTVSGNDINGGGNGAGIEADAFDTETTTITAANNSVVNMNEGIITFKDPAAVINFTINNNSITGSAVNAIHNYGATAVNATCNWYGTTDGAAVASKISGSVGYTPFSINGTDNQPAITGFQPVPGSCSNCVTPDITKPTITLKPNPTVFLTAANTYTIQLNDVLQSVTDNCDPNPAATVSTLNVTCNNNGSGTIETLHQAYVSNTAAGNANYDGQFGMSFKVNNANGVVIDKLGAFDDQGNGISGNQNGGVRVAIFNVATQAIVPGLDVTISGNTDALVNNYRIRSVSPVTLPAGTYVLVTKGYVGEKFCNRNQSGALNPVGDNASGALSFLNTAYYSSTPAFGFPSGSGNAGNPNEYIAGTFTYALSTGNSVTVTATDVSGNQSQVSTTVTVVDTFYVLTTKDITVNLNSTGNASIQPTDVLQSLKNNCGIDVTTSTLQVSPSTFTCADIAGSAAPHQAYTSNSSTGNDDYLGELGLKFSVNSASGVVINKLGAFDHQNNGITGTQNGGVRVAIFNAGTQSIVPGLDVTISGGADALVNNYRMRSITPVTLPQGSYVMVVKGYQPGELFSNRHLSGPLNPTGDNAAGALSFLNTIYYGPNTASGFSFPNGNQDAGNPNEYVGGTFSYSSSDGTSSTPEPHQAYTSNSSTGNDDYLGELGLKFSVNSASGVVINKLGAFDHQNNGITGTQNGGVRVAIFNAATQSIVPGLDVIISGGADLLVNNYRIRSISPVSLPQGSYVMVVKGYQPGELFSNRHLSGPLNPTGDNAAGALSFLTTIYYGPNTASGFSFPSNNLDAGNPNEYVGGTFSYSSSDGTSSTPEPHQAYTSNSSTGNDDYLGELGLKFSVNSASGVVINKLGAFDHQNNGITGTQNGGVRVAIFNAATQSIVPGLDVIISGGADLLVNNYRIRSISPVSLPQGSYVMVVKGYQPGELFSNRHLSGPLNPVGDNAAGALSFLNIIYYGPNTASGFSFPNNNLDAGNPNEYVGGTFNYTLPNDNITVSNTKTVTVTAIDIYGNIIRATAIITLTNTSGSCTSAPSQLYVAQNPATPELVTDLRKTDVSSVFNNLSMSPKVYPNPSTGQFTIQLYNLKVPKLTLQITDASGRIVEQKTVTLTGKTPALSIPVDISRQAAGIYLIKITSADGVQTAKVVVSR